MKNTMLWAIRLIQSIIVPIIVFVHQHRIMQKVNEANMRTENRKTESLLLLNMTYATAELANATAIALKRGQANGEIEKAMKTYKKAKDQYAQFLHEQAQIHLHETA